VSLSSYLLVGLVRGDRAANEAVLKYFIFAAAALAVMAYGLTFLYGLTGSLELRMIGQALADADRVWIAIALALVVVGYAFEMTLAPFHFWAPDVYHGASAPIAGCLSVVPKIAGFAGFIRFILLVFPGELLAWPLLVSILAVATMLLGNLVALRQTRLKRLLAYSSITQAGYVMIAVAVAGRVSGALEAAAYYLAA
jgi:NADH-quinone oxidoreductase subunit N